VKYSRHHFRAEILRIHYNKASYCEIAYGCSVGDKIAQLIAHKSSARDFFQTAHQTCNIPQTTGLQLRGQFGLHPQSFCYALQDENTEKARIALV
jgi:hypothetical protein